MKYIVASDFDGTLIQNGVVNDKTVNAIKKLQILTNPFVKFNQCYVY